MRIFIKLLIILVVVILLFMGIAFCVGKLNGVSWQSQIQEWFKKKSNNEMTMQELNNNSCIVLRGIYE